MVAGGAHGNAVCVCAQIAKKWSAFLPGFDRTKHWLEDMASAEEGGTTKVTFQGTAVHFVAVDASTEEQVAEPFWIVAGRYETVVNNADNRIVAHTFTAEKQHGSVASLAPLAMAKAPKPFDAAVRPKVLVLGATGVVGSRVVALLQEDGGALNVEVVAAVRRQSAADKFAEQGVATRHLDFDDMESYGPALEGISYLFLATGYTVRMLHHSKALVDAARDAGVAHIVHLGVAIEANKPAARLVNMFAWHREVETYVEAASGASWTHLRPGCFFHNFARFFPNWDAGTLRLMHFFGDKKPAYVDTEDISALAAAVLRHPAKHRGRVYHLRFEQLSGDEGAAVIADVTGRPATAVAFMPDPPTGGDEYFRNFLPQLLAAGKLPGFVELRGAAEFEAIVGRSPRTFRQYVEDNVDAWAPPSMKAVICNGPGSIDNFVVGTTTKPTAGVCEVDAWLRAVC